MRLTWIDSLRGFLIYLVVLYHVIAATFVVPDLVDSPMLDSMSKVVTDGLRPVRMPLFFLVSGTLASRAVRRSWLDLLRRKVLLFLWVFVLWAALVGLARYFAPGRGSSDVDLFGEVVNGLSGMWFLAALMIYFPITKLVMSAPRLVQGFSVVSILVAYLFLIDTPLDLHANAIVSNYLFFLIGVMVPSFLLKASDRAGVRVAAGLFLFIGAQLVDLLIGSRTSVMLLVASFGACLWIPPLFARWLNVETVASRVGRETLAIYATHNLTAPLFALISLLAWMPIVSEAGGLLWLVAMPPAIIAVCMLMRRVSSRFAPWLYEVPTAIARAR